TFFVSPNAAAVSSHLSSWPSCFFICMTSWKYMPATLAARLSHFLVFHTEPLSNAAPHELSASVVMKRLIFSLLLSVTGCSAEAADAPPPVETDIVPDYAPIAPGSISRACVPNGAACSPRVSWTSWTSISSLPACWVHVDNCGQYVNCGPCRDGSCQ